MDGSRAPLLTRPGWLFAEPVDLDQIVPRWAEGALAPVVTGSESEADSSCR
jgi:hypothetical protein